MLQLWNNHVIQIVGRLPVPLDWTTDVDFSPDGNALAASTRGGGIQIFRAPSFEETDLAYRKQTMTEEELDALDKAFLRANDELEALKRRQREEIFAGDPGSINEWLLLGPIPRSEQQGLEYKPLPDETGLRPRSFDMIDVDGLELNWRQVVQKNPVFSFLQIYTDDPVVGLTNLAHQTVFAVSYVHCDRAMTDVTVKTGGDDNSIIYLNGREIHRSTEWSNPSLDHDEISGVRLEKGVNRLVFRVDNNAGEWGGSVRLTDPNGNPPEGIRVSLDPEG